VGATATSLLAKKKKKRKKPTKLLEIDSGSMRE
jgi:hypothetical protein